MLNFKKATIPDVPLLQKLAHTIWYSHYPGIISEKQIEYMLELMYSVNIIAKEIHDGFQWFVIFDDVQPIGFLAYSFESEHKVVKLNKLYILASYHGKGFGNQSLLFIKEKCLELGAVKLYLTVNKQNTKAIKAYLKAGFYTEKEVVADIGNGYVMDDYVMALDL